MIYLELAAIIADMTDEQQQAEVTLWEPHSDEFMGIQGLVFADPKECDQLDPGHPSIAANE